MQLKDSSQLSGLDGSIKKNTSFIKKLKMGVTAAQAQALQRDALCLKLDKYMEEVAASIADALYKTGADVLACVELCSLVNQRYPVFQDLLFPLIMKQIPSTVTPIPNDREEALRISRLRSAMRLITEMYLVHFILDPSESLIPSLLESLFANDKLLANLPLAATFLKYYSTFFVLKQSNDDVSLLPVSESVRIASTAIMTGYFERVAKALVVENKRICRLEKNMNELYIKRGKIVDEKQSSFERAMNAFERLRGFASSIAESLGAQMPVLQEDESTVNGSIGISDKAVDRDDNEPKSFGIWEDEETRRFYQNISDLENQVPAILLGTRKIPKTQSVENPAEATEQETVAEHDPPMSVDAIEPFEATSPIDMSARVILDGILAKLPDSANTDMIDKLAIEFAFQNSKNARNKLAQTLLEVPRQRTDLLPYYSRLLATLHPFMPEVGEYVVEQLQSSFRYHQRKKEQMFVEEKIKNIRFLGELTKFRVTPTFVIFNCLKVLLDDFTHFNVDVLCVLLDSCGRFLYRNPDTCVRMQSFIDILQRKKTSSTLDTRQVLMVENALYECNPPERKDVVKKQRTPVELFYRKLIYQDLSKATVTGIIKLFRKANWEDDDTRKMLGKFFFKVWKVKFSNLGVLAYLLCELTMHYPSFGVMVVDNVLEEVRVGLETNIFKHNQRRISTVKFLGELYNYKMLDSAVIFESLYLLLRFGYENGIPLPNSNCPLDAPNDFFRMRLVCTLLNACGHNFASGSTGKKLDDFLSFMQVIFSNFF